MAEAVWVRAVRRDPAARRIVQAWRRLTTPDRAGRAGAGEGTLVACSGGADSSALVLALAAAVSGGKAGRPRIVVAHVVHDLRTRREAEADRDAARRLAEMVGAEFVEAKVRVKTRGEGGGGNLEGAARNARYAALAKLARQEGLRFVATAHHGDDQLETVLMALMRGAGPRGLRGVRAARMLDGEGEGRIRLLRPMLTAAAGREDSERICRVAGWEWAVDATNADETRLRAAVRSRIVPVMKSLRPDAAERACVTAAIMADADSMISARAESLMAMPSSGEGGARAWERDRLRFERRAVLGELIGRAASELRARGAGRKKPGMGTRAPRPDALSYHAVMPAIRAIRDDSTEPRRFEVGNVRIEVTARTVTIAGRSGR